MDLFHPAFVWEASLVGTRHLSESLQVRSLQHCRLWLVVISFAFCGCGEGERVDLRTPPPTPSITSPASPHQPTHKGAVAVNDVATRITFETRSVPAEFNNGRSTGIEGILETLGGGVAAIDYDRDGWPDLFFAGGGLLAGEMIIGAASRLLRGGAASDWSRTAELPARIAQSPVYSHGCAAADFNNDGFVDLLLTGYGGVQLFENQGDGTFAECAAKYGIADSGWSTGAGWGDLNGDGVLDLYLAHYVEWTLAAHRKSIATAINKSEVFGPKYFAAMNDRAFLGNGDGTFREASADLGIQPGGKGLGVVLGDVDLDHDVDIYVVNDTTENFLYLNDGTGHFQEVGALNGAAFDDDGRPTGSMGGAFGDFDGDGLPDLWTTNFEEESLALYRNMGQSQFHYTSRTAGATAIGSQYVGWGTSFDDFDRDGDLDVVVSTGHLPGYVPEEKLVQLPLLLLNNAHGRLERARFAASSAGNAGAKEYFSQPHQGRGLAVGDLNRDGQLDLVLSHLSGPAAVLLNGTPDGNHALQVTLVGTQSNRDAIGAFAVLETTAGTQLRVVMGGGSYLSHSELSLHWGYPHGTQLKRLTIHWPAGHAQVVDQLVDDSRLIIVED